MKGKPATIDPYTTYLLHIKDNGEEERFPVPPQSHFVTVKVNYEYTTTINGRHQGRITTVKPRGERWEIFSGNHEKTKWRRSVTT